MIFIGAWRNSRRGSFLKPVCCKLTDESTLIHFLIQIFNCTKILLIWEYSSNIYFKNIFLFLKWVWFGLFHYRNAWIIFPIYELIYLSSIIFCYWWANLAKKRKREAVKTSKINWSKFRPCIDHKSSRSTVRVRTRSKSKSKLKSLLNL